MNDAYYELDVKVPLLGCAWVKEYWSTPLKVVPRHSLARLIRFTSCFFLSAPLQTWLIPRGSDKLAEV
jgi:hypothetical protein